MKNIVTIGGGNGHSHVLACLKESDFFGELQIHALVSMSDDGRTTGKLMQQFEARFGRHLPPPGDLRRCLYALSESEYAGVFQKVLEHEIVLEGKIKDYSLLQLFESHEVDKEFLEYLNSKNDYFLNFSLDIDEPIAGHKFGNIMMACLYQNFLYDYNYMLRVMHDLLGVSSQVIAITTDKAYIEAELENGKIVQKQDNISNAADYHSKIKALRLMSDSYHAKHNFKIDSAILNAEYILISPGDLYTSTISNLIIGGINSLLRKTNAKIIYIGNTTNKGGETEGYSTKDFTQNLELYLGKTIDVLVLNNAKAELSDEEYQAFQSDISVKGGQYIYLDDEDRAYYRSRGTRVIEIDLLSDQSFYKHDMQKLENILKKILI